VDGIDLIEANIGQKPNRALQSRRAHIITSREFDMIGCIRADIFFQERYMLNKLGIKVRLVRSKDAFCLMGETPNNAKFDITHAALFVQKVKISPSVFIAHAQGLQNSMAKYPLKRPSARCLPFRNITET